MTTTPTDAVPAGERSPLRRLYRWTEQWADSPYGTWALAALAFVESSFFPIPPDVLLIALSVAMPRRALWYAFVCSVASVLGGVVGWWIGLEAYELVGRRIIETLGYEREFVLVRGYYQGNAFLAILAAAFTPIPYKVFTIAAGVFEVPLSTLVAASVLGRSGRFFLVGGAIYLFGPTVKRWLDRYLEVATVGLLVLAVLGVLAIRWFSP
ncbi:MAG TPA: YqaA family protein [Thermodesulfobacteriota bacterium]